MTFGLSRIAGEVVEPITLADAKLHLRVDGDTDDDLIGSMITSARTSCERRMQRSVVQQSWALTQSCFGRPWLDHREREWQQLTNPDWYRTVCRGSHDSIVLSNPPIQSVSSVAYLSESYERVTLDPATYRLAVVSETLAMLRPVGVPWPRAAREPDAVIVTYLAGYAEPDQIPGPVLSWIKLRIGSLYASREDFIAGLTVAMSPFADGLIEPYSIPTV
jgi:uncharacterized phiE125 gp8 family phage protein